MDWVNLTRRLWLPAQRWIVAILVAASGIFTAQLTWLWLQPAPEITAPRIVPISQSQSQVNRNPEQLGAAIGNRALFGTFEPVVEAAPERPVEAPDTQLRMTLQAVLAQSGDGTGFAIIGQRGGQSSAFSVGDDVFDQATLTAVYNDRVILDRNGQLETLRYERKTTSELLQVNDEPIESSVASSDLRAQVGQAQRRADRGEDVQTQVEQVVSYVQQRANSDPQGLLDEVGLEATGAGYEVTQNARQLAMAGLRPGDIVTAVNDQVVGNIGQDQALLNQILQTGGELKIQVRRGSRSFTIYQSIPRF